MFAWVVNDSIIFKFLFMDLNKFILIYIKIWWDV
jgi:hypothetical protein